MLIDLINDILSDFFDLIFPERCIGCGKDYTILCSDCLNKLHHLNCYSVRGRAPIEKFISVLPYSELPRKIILKLKFKKKRSLAVPLAKLMAEILTKELPTYRDYFLLPVPMHSSRLRDRGFNQAELLSDEIASSLQLESLNKLVTREKKTSFMYNLKSKLREKNIKGAFKLHDPQQLTGKNILIVDDILTTGSTIYELAKLLKKGGAAKIYALTLARTE